MVPCGENGEYTGGDSFSGAGGVSEGFMANPKVKMVFAINHSKEAIDCYSENNPNCQVFLEDWTKLDEKLLPKKINFFWMSAECTHHSIAAGGNSRDADSRSLPEHAPRYIKWTNPDYFMVENVKEFLTWGPVIPKLDKEGNPMISKKGKNKGKVIMKPDPARKREFYEPWVQSIIDLGYTYEYRLLNSADYGAHTSRVRYFGTFAKEGLPIIWPAPTHDKHGRNGLKKHNACREKIRTHDEGQSIFGRQYNMSLPKNLRRPLVPASLKRIAKGMIRHCLSDFIAKSYSSGGQWSGLDEPLHTITTVDRHALIQIEKGQFLTRNMHQSLNSSSLDNPIPPLVTKDNYALVSVEKSNFITQTIQKTDSSSSLNEPIPTILTRDEKSLITVEKSKFMLNNYSPGYSKSMDDPLPAITTIPHQNMITVELSQFIYKDNGGELNTQSIDEPVHTIVTADSKKLVTVVMDNDTELDRMKEEEKRQFILTHFGTGRFKALDEPLGSITTVTKETLITVDILCGMIKDVKMRYLSSDELAGCTGFRKGMSLGKSETKRKHHIGNAVPPIMSYSLSKALTN